MVNMGKTLESAEGLVGGYEELKKKMQSEIEVLQLRSEQLLAENDQLDKVKMKLQTEVKSLMVTKTSVKFDIPIREDDVWPNLEG